MEAATQTEILSLAPYRHLFPPARVVDQTVKFGATVSDTVNVIPRIVALTRWQVKEFVKAELSKLSPYEALRKLWFFVKCHIEYEKDRKGYEEVRSPRRLIHDQLGDCDCFTTYLDACFTWMKGIKKVVNRITKYKENYFQHIYPVVKLDDGSTVIMDCVTHAFNYEEPYSEKKDYSMELQFLDGIGDLDYTPYDDDLGKINIFKKGGLKQVVNKVGDAIQTAAKKTGDFVKDKAGDVLHAVNKVNPATVLLRAGVLAAMKINMMNVAGRLKWAYLSDDVAKQKGADMNQLSKLKGVMKKLEDIFHGAGGEPKNLRAAILEGKGNKDKSVSGLGAFDVNTPLSQLIGEDIYYTENINGLEGLGELGEPVTATAIAAASGAIATIAALIKNISKIFPNGSAGAKDFDAGESEEGGVTAKAQPTVMDQVTQAINKVQNIAPTFQKITQNFLPKSLPNASQPQPSTPQNSPTIKTASIPINAQTLTTIQNQKLFTPGEQANTLVSDKDNTPTPKDTTTQDDPKDSWWTRNKAWMIPTIVAGGATVITLGYFALRPKPQPKFKEPTLSGIEDGAAPAMVEEEIEELHECECHKEKKKPGPKSRLKAIDLM